MVLASKDGDIVEFITNENGTISIILKNIEKLEDK